MISMSIQHIFSAISAAAIILSISLVGCADIAHERFQSDIYFNRFIEEGANGSVNTVIKSAAIAKWLDGTAAAVSFTFDDNNSAQYKIIAPILEEYSFRGSFFVNPGIFATPARRHHATWNDTKDGYREIARKGHEIGNHSWSHANLTRLNTREEIVAQVTRPLDVIKEDIGVRPVSFVHPFNKSNKIVDEIVFEHHLFARISSTASLSDRIIGPIGSKRHNGALPSRFENALKNNGWLIIAGHGVEGEGWRPVSAEFLHEICRMIIEADRTIFVGTFAEVAAYEHIRRDLEIEMSVVEDGLRLDFRGFDVERYASLPRAPITFLLFRNDDDQSEPLTLLAGGEPLCFDSEKNAYVRTVDLKRSNTVHISAAWE